MRHRITIERRGPGRDPVAGATGAWVVVASCWAAIEADGDGATAVDERLAAWPRYRATIRMRGDVDPGCRVKWRGGTYRLLGVIADPVTPDRMTLRMEQTA